MRACPSCRQPLVLELKDGKEMERCTNPNCKYKAWIVPLEHTKTTPKLGGWGVKLTPADDVDEGGV